MTAVLNNKTCLQNPFWLKKSLTCSFFCFRDKNKTLMMKFEARLFREGTFLHLFACIVLNIISRRYVHLHTHLVMVVSLTCLIAVATFVYAIMAAKLEF